jgi:phosphoglycolate phosphatase
LKTSGLLFDLDGTLTDPKVGIVASIRFAMDKLGYPLDEALDLDWCIGPPLQDSLTKLLGNMDRSKSEEALNFYRERYRNKGIYENRLYPGIVGALEVLAETTELYIATSKPTLFANEIVSHFGLGRFFEAIYGSDMDGKNANKADLIRTIVSERGLQSRDCVMIGDREHDMIGAKANGLRGIGVLWGYGSREELKSSGAEATLETPEDLVPYFL